MVSVLPIDTLFLLCRCCGHPHREMLHVDYYADSCDISIADFPTA